MNMRVFKQMRIKHKLFLAYAGISLAILMLSFSFLYFQMRSSITKRIRKELVQSNQVITDMVETAATVSIKSHLKAVAERNHEIIACFYQQYQDAKLTKAEAMDRAVQVLMSQRIGKTGYIYCIDSRGVVRVHPKKSLINNSVLNYPFVIAQVKTKKGYIEYDWKNPGESLARPKALYMSYFEPWDWIISVTSYKSEFLDLVSSHDFKDSISALTFGETGYAFIFDTAGNFIIHPRLPGNALKDQAREVKELLHEMVKRKQGFLTYTWKNPSEPGYREKLTAFDTIAAFNWIVASSSYTREVFSPLAEMKRYVLIILTLALVATGVVTLGVSSSITNPLVSLINQFEKCANGKLFFRMDSNRGDEIGKLSRSLNLFMDRLETYQRDLVKENKVRKIAEKEIRNLQNYLANIINSMPSILIGIDRELKVIFWNGQAEKQTGISASNAHGRSVYEVYPRLDVNMEKLKHFIDRNASRHFSKRPDVLPKKELSFADIIVYPLGGAEKKGAVIRIDDVTEKVQMEEMLIQNEKIISLGGLAAGMAHEINNPLAGMIQNANVLSNRLINPALPVNMKAAREAGTSMEAISAFMVSRDIPRMLEVIRESGVRIIGIVENMLSFARKGSFRFSNHDPVELVDKTLVLASTDYDMKKQYDFRSIKIKKEYEDDLPMLDCEPGKIQQVILNILHNGAHAMFENSGGAEPTFILRLYNDKNTGMLNMEIEDNGPGMDEETRRRIFEPFFTTKPVGVGTGLGLSVSHFIITDTHGGTLNVTSEKGKGTNFTIRLPIKKNGLDG